MKQAYIIKMNELLSSQTPFVTSTIVKYDGSTPRKIGAKMITYLNHGKVEIFETIGGGKLELSVMNDAEKILRENFDSVTIEYRVDETVGMACGGGVEVFHEVTASRTDLYIFGAGHVGQALARVLEGGPFTMHVIDERSEWALSEKLPNSVIKHNKMWSEVVDELSWNKENSYSVIMTHTHIHDNDILENIIKRDWKYVGLMGSKNKWADSHARLKDIAKEELKRVTCPIGNKKLGKGPTEIAIGIAEELLRIYHGK